MSIAQTPAEARPTPDNRSPRLPERPFYVTGGTLPPDASSYVPRLADRELYDGLLTGEYCYVLNTRQMGKSSLMIRTAQRLREAGCAVAVLDLTAIGQNLTVEQWYDGLLISLAEQIGLDDEMEDFWEENAHLGPMQRFLAAIRQVVLPHLAERKGRDVVNSPSLVLFVDEIDAVRSLPFSVNEFFGGIRECYNRRAQDAAFERLTFCLLGVATPADLIDDTRISPFNVGRRIMLSDFTPAEAASLAQGMGPKGAELLARVLYWTNGHPYMTQRLCRSVAEAALLGSVHQADVDRLCDNLFLSKAARDTDDNLAFVRTRLLRSDADLASLLDLYQKVRNGKRVPDDETNPLCSVLRLSGVVRVDERGFLQVRNRIYDRVFDKDWVIAHMPDAELRRQKAAYRNGLFRAASVGTAFTVALGGLAAYAFVQQSRAEQNLQIASEQKTRAESEKARAQRQTAEAERQTGIADKARQDAESQKIEAEKQRAEADKQKAAAQDANKQLNLSLAEVEKQRQRAKESADSALTSQKEAVVAKNDAVAQRDEAVKQKGEADQQRKSARQNLVSLAVYKGLRLAEDGDYASAAPYLAGARRLEASNPQRDPVHRTRIAETILRTPRLVNLWSVGKSAAASGYPVGFTAEGATLLEAGWRPANLSTTPGEDPSDRAQGGAIIALWTPGDGAQRNPRPLTFADAAPHHLIYVSPDGRIALSQTPAKREGYVRLRVWSVADAGRPIAPLSVPWETAALHHPTALTVSQDGSRVAVSDIQGKFRVADMATGKTLLERAGDGPFALSPDGKYLAYVGQRPGSSDWGAQIVRVDDGKALEDVIRSKISALRFSPDGSRLAVTMPYSTRLYNMKSVRQGDGPRLLSEPQTLGTKYALSSAFAPDSRSLAIGNGDGGVNIFDVTTGRAAGFLQVADGGVSLLAFSPDGSLLAAGGLSQTLRVWRTGSLSLVGSLHHAAQVGRCAFSPDSRLLLTGDYGGSGRLWDMYQSVPGGRPLVAVVGTELINDLTFSPDGQALAAMRSGGEVVVADARTGVERFAPLPALKLDYRGRPERRVRFSPNSRLLAFHTDAAAFVYDARTGERLLTVRPSSSEKAVALRRILFTPDSRQAVTADSAGIVQFRDIASGKVTMTLPAPKEADDALHEIALSPDGNILAVATRRETVLWNRVTGATTRLEGTKDFLPGDRLIFRPDGRTLLCYGYSAKPEKVSESGKNGRMEAFEAVVWDTTTGRALTRLVHPDHVNAAAFSPDGRRILTASGSKAYLWDAATGRPLAPPLLHKNTITDVVFTRDGAMAATTGLDATVRVWDAANGAFVLQRTGQEANRTIVTSMVCLAVPPNSQEIVGGGWVGVASWELPQTPGTPEETVRVARLLACEDFDPAKGNIPMTQARVDADWKELGSDALMGGTVPVNTETLRRAASYEMGRWRWSEAEQAATELLRRTPCDLDALETRASARANRGDYRSALADVERSVAVRGEPTDMATERAMLLVTLSENDSYRALSRRIAALQTSEPGKEKDYSFLRYLTYAPNAVDSYDRPVQMLERTVALMPDSQDGRYVLTGLLYRAGRYADALAQREKLSDKRNGGTWPVRECGANLFAAMSYARLNRPDKARELLAKARQVREEIPANFWRGRLEADLLEKEARELIGK